jgi:hypothetical protein
VSGDELREFRTVVEYDGDTDAQLIYGPDLEDGAEQRARNAAKRFRGRDFERTAIHVESRAVEPWQTVVVHHDPDRTPPHPAEDVANDPTLAEEAHDDR